MRKEDMFDFLLRAAIPANKENSYPSNAKNKNERLAWDCIKRANRDVLTGRFWMVSYITKSKKIEKSLYDTIVSTANKGLKSEELIKQLSDEYKGVEFGALQKLVNMTLKYLFILQLFGKLETKEFTIDEDDCDCPLDSNILSTIKGYNNIRWTKDLDWDIYKKIQNAISDKNSGARLKYDFDKWQSFGGKVCNQ